MVTFHASIFVGTLQATQKAVFHLLEKEKIHALDQHFLVEKTIGIGQIKELQLTVSKKPFVSTQKAAIIHGEHLTLEAQHALLKTLEEPPPNTLLIIMVPNSALLIPTIISRSKICSTNSSEMSTTDPTTENEHEFWLSFAQKSLGERMKELESFAKDRQSMIDWLSQQIIYFHQIMQKKYSQNQPVTLEYNIKVHEILQILLTVKSQCEKNFNTKLLLDQICLTFPLHKAAEKSTKKSVQAVG